MHVCGDDVGCPDAPAPWRAAQLPAVAVAGPGRMRRPTSAGSSTDGRLSNVRRKNLVLELCVSTHYHRVLSVSGLFFLLPGDADGFTESKPLFLGIDASAFFWVGRGEPGGALQRIRS